MISKEQIQEVKDKTDILSLIQSYITVKKSGRTHKACCPFHNEKTPSFHISQERQNYHCFGCGEHGSAYDFVMKMEGLDFPNAVRLLAQRAGVMLIENTNPEQIAKAKKIKEGKDKIHDMLEKLTQWYVSQLYTREGAIAMNYLRSRGIDDQTIQRFRLGYSPDSWDACKKWALEHGYTYKDLLDAGLMIVPEKKTDEQGYDRFRGRLMFPIWNDNGNVVGYSARTLKNENAKYINSPDSLVFHKSSILYAFPLAKPGFREHNFAILCEGQLDVIACHRAGLANAVAPQGTAFTAEQAKLLKRFNSKVVVAFDADNAGRKAAARCYDEMAAIGLEMSVVTLPNGEDPDGIFSKYGPAGLQAAFKNPRDFFEVGAEQINQTQFDTTTAKSAAIGELLQKITLIDDGIARQLKLQQLAASLKISEDILQAEMQKLIDARNRRDHFQKARNQQQPPQQHFQSAPKASGPAPAESYNPDLPPIDSYADDGYVEEGYVDEYIPADGGDYAPPADSPPPFEMQPQQNFQKFGKKKGGFYKKGGKYRKGRYGKYGGDDYEQPQEPTIPANALSKEVKAMHTLLDLGIYHGFIAHYLVKELKPEYLPEGLLSDMLQELAGHTIQGEWKHVGQILSEHYADRATPEVKKILESTAHPEFNAETEEMRKKIQAMVTDCLLTLHIPYFEKKEKELMSQLSAEKDLRKKREMYQKLQELMQAKQQARSHITRDI